MVNLCISINLYKNGYLATRTRDTHTFAERLAVELSLPVLRT